MPIDIETFSESNGRELERVTNAERVLRYLYENREHAFTAGEIAERTGVKSNSIGTVLRRLEERNLVRHKGDYWAIGEIDRVREASELHRTLDRLDEEYGPERESEWRAHASDGTDE
ncbi:MAG: MarR family transcriptional regulator [Halobacteriota archaeon]